MKDDVAGNEEDHKERNHEEETKQNKESYTDFTATEVDK